jgi:hypothetical protein
VLFIDFQGTTSISWTAKHENIVFCLSQNSKMRWTIATILFFCSPVFNAQSILADIGPAAPKSSGSQGQAQQPQGQQSQIPQPAPPAQSSQPKPVQDQGTEGNGSPNPKGQSPIGQSQQPKNAPNGGKSGKGDGYEGYSLTQKGDPGSTYYETANTKTNDSSPGIGNVTLAKEPDVHLNVSQKPNYMAFY